MSVGGGAGFDLSFLESLKKYDLQIEKLTEHTDAYGANAIKTFSDIATKGVEPTLKKLLEQKEALEALANLDLKEVKGFKNLGKEIDNTLDKINLLIDTLDKTVNGNKASTVTSPALDGLMAQINELNEERMRLEEQSSKGTLSFQDAQWAGEITDEINRLISAYEALAEAQRRLSDTSLQPHINAVSGESNEAQQYSDAMQAMREFYAEQEKEQQRSLKEQAKAEEDAYRDALARMHSKHEEEKRMADEHFDEMRNKINAQNQSTDFLVGMQGSMKTLSQLERYLDLLSNKMNNLDPDTEEWKKLNAILQETSKKVGDIKKAMRGFDDATQDVGNSLEKTEGKLGGIGRAIASAFSVKALVGYANQIKNTYKEFEKMSVALKTMVGSLEDSNRIWKQTLDFAKVSPFTTKELFSYTRQLAAYRIETDKLHDTTKMLADVSAGLGVDMNRLILAYGQVRAAEYLRGTELRQFTEAGIPMLDELAKHFSKLEQRAVSTAEVFDMISKRLVDFEDVNTVFENMTGSDGIFYKMQEQIANTLYGSIENLKDEIDIMMYEIGKSNSGAIKGIVNLLRKMVRSWQDIAVAMKFALGLFASYQVASVAAAISSGTLATSTSLAAVGVRALSAALKTLTATPIGIILSIASAIWALSTPTKEAQAAMERQKERAQELAQALKELTKKYDTMREHAQSAVDTVLDENSSFYEAELAVHKLIGILNDEYNIEVKVNLEKLTKEDIANYVTSLQSTANSILGDIEQLDYSWKEAKLGGGLSDYFSSPEKYLDAVVKDLGLEQRWSQTLAKGVLKFASPYGQAADLIEDEFLRSSETDFASLADNIKKHFNEQRDKIVREFKSYSDELIQSLGYDSIKTKEDLVAAIDILSPAEVWKIFFEARAKDKGWDDVEEYIAQDLVGNQALWNDAITMIDFIQTKADEFSKKSLASGNPYAVFTSWFNKAQKDNEFLGYGNLLKKQLDKSLGTVLKESEKELTDFQKVVNKFLTDKAPKVDMIAFAKKEGLSDEDIKEYTKFLAGQGDKLNLGEFVLAFEKGDKRSQEEFTKSVKESIESYQKTIAEYEHGISTVGESAISRFKYIMSKAALSRLLPLGNLLGIGNNNAKKDEENIIKKRIDLIRDMYKRYTDEYKLFGAEAKQIIQDSYKDAFKSIFKGIKINFEDINFTSPEGVAESLEKLRATAKRAGKKYVDELEKAIAEFESQANSARRKNDNQRLVDTIQSMFDDYELTLDLKEIFVSADLGKTLFDVDFTNYEQLYAKVFDTLLKNRTDVINELLKELEDSYSKFNGTMDKVTLENLDKFKDSVIKTNGTELYYKEGGRIGKGTKEDIREFQSDLNTLILTVDAVKELRAELQKEIKDIDWTKITDAFGGDLGKEVKDILDRLNSMYDEKIIENMKKYMEYTRSSLGDAAKARLEYLTKVREINDTFKEEDEKGTKEEIANIQKRNAIVKAERERALTMAKQDMDRALMELEWDNFTSSETFTSLLGDMSMASDELLRKVIEDIDEFRKVWGHLPLHEMEEVIKLREKAEAALSASKGVYDRRREIKSKLGETTRAQAEKDAYEKSKAATDLEKHYRNLQLLQQQLNSSETLSVDNLKQLGLDAEKYTVYLKDRKKLEEDIAKIEAGEDKKDSLAYANKEARAAQDKVELFNELNRLYEAESKALSDINSKAQELYGAFKEIHEALGEDGDSWQAVFSEMGMQMTDVVLSTMSLQANLKAATTDVEIFGMSMNAAMGVVGWIVMGVQLFAKVISAIAKAQDNKHVKTIEEQAREIDKLKKSYDKLAESMDEAWSVTQMAQRAEAMKNYTEKMIAAQEKAIEAQEKRKGANIEGSDTWKELQDMYEELDEMRGQYAEDMKDVFSSLTDGILDSVTDAAREFTDAWYDAFKETGDGLSGLNETFDEMLANLTKNLVSRTLTTQWVNQWQEELKSFINPEEGVFSLDAENIKAWAEKVRDTLPALSAALEGSLEVMKDVITTEDNNLSELQKGIQGVTEQTAQVLEALLNSMRAEVQSQTRYMKLMWEMMSNAYNASSTNGFNVRLIS